MRVVAGRFRGRRLATPDGAAIRPTTDRVREAIFAILNSRLGSNFNGIKVLDLFAGTGALGIEALSRGAEGCVFVDSGVEARALLRENIEHFGLGGRARLLRRDATKLGIPGNLGPFDLVFADPPYGKDLGERALEGALAGGWLAADALLVLEDTAESTSEVSRSFEVLDRRTYGDTKITLMTPSAGPGATGAVGRSTA